MKCLSCGAETSNGLAACEQCRYAARIYLEFLPIYFRNLARWRPGRAGGRPVPGSRVLYVGETRVDRTGDRISDALDEAMNDLLTWARQLVDDRPETFLRPKTLTDAVLTGDLPREVADDLNDNPHRKVAALCAGLEDHLTSVATLDWVGDFVRGLGRHESLLRGLTEFAIPGWYAGACRRCEHPTYVVSGLTWVTCGGCGVTTYARDHLETVRQEARGWVATPMRLAEAAVALLDTEESVPRLYERIKKWATREHIATVRDNEYALKRHRFGEVLDRLQAEGQTRTSVADTAKSA